MQERRFALMGLGTRIKILSTRPSTHTDKFGGSSASFMAEVVGIGIIEPEKVLEKMPFMTVQSGDDVLTLPPAVLPSDSAACVASLAEATALCARLEEVASYQGPLTQASEQRRRRDAEGDDCDSLASTVDLVLGLRGAAPNCEGSRLLVSALAATAHLPGATRFEAMELARQGLTSELLALVDPALEEEGKRRLAVKALAQLGGKDDRSE